MEPKRLTDLLLTQLEELNLEGVDDVPDSYEPMLADLRDHLVAQPGLEQRIIDRLHPGARTAELIEAIFSIQEVITPPTLPAGEFPFDDAELDPAAGGSAA